MKILSVNVPLRDAGKVERTMALLSVRNWITRIDPDSMPLIEIDAEMGEPLCTIVMTEKDRENLKALLVWADLYFQSTDNSKNEYALDRLHKLVGNPPVDRGKIPSQPS